MGEDEEDKKKPHRQRHAGRKQEKKKQKTEHQQELSDKQKNPKAFTFNSVVRAERRFRRKQDLKSKKEHIPVVDRTPLEPPPILVAVVGPAKVGKSTLIHSLIKSYTRQPLSTIKGPVTVVSGKKRRITLMECNNDINCMVDIAKVADLVLLLIDASFGFEMEIFEFLNICQVHGMPKIMGVLTHLDMIKQTKKLQRTKKMLKRRFWTEVYAGAKLFYLSGMQHGEYLRNEVKNLARFISVMKFRPLTWQTSHPYLLADRMEDLTPPDDVRVNPKTDRKVSLYGYMRGLPMNNNSSIHIPGCGDFTVTDICFLPDPCPLPEQLKKRSLIEKERLLYAPFSGVGGIVYDKDAVYIETKTTSSKKGEGESEIVSSLLETRETIDEKLMRSQLQLFSNSVPISSGDFEATQGDSEDEEDMENSHKGVKRKHNLEEDEGESDEDSEGDEEAEEEDDDRSEEDDDESEEEDQKAPSSSGPSKPPDPIRSKISSALASIEGGWSECSSSDEEGEELEKGDKSVPWNKDESDDSAESDEELEDTENKWKSNLAEKAALAFIERQTSTNNIFKLVYGGQTFVRQEEKEEDDGIGGLFKIIDMKSQQTSSSKDTMNALDSSKFVLPNQRDWSQDSLRESIKDCFVTGKWKLSEDASELLKLDDMSDEELEGDWEDLETGEKHEKTEESKTEKKETLTKEQLLEKKKKLKERFDQAYDNHNSDDETTYFDELKNEAKKQSEFNRSQFEDLDDSMRVKLEGFRAGMYVRIEIDKAPCELVENFDPTYPVVIGGLQPLEQNVGFVKVRVKKHRWFHKILKSKDPLIISMGWRRFQTIAVYSKQEDNMRFRMLKYTPEHVSCMGHFWGPITKAATGFLAILNTSLQETPGFRISATGAVVDCNQSAVVTKKLKLVGTPLKIYKKTAYVQGMFNSSLEVAKFEGAKIKTVSGIRGQIKRAVNNPEGAFRATFEDKIMLSDIVFCRTWYKVDIPQLYLTVTTLLLPLDQKNSWRGMKTVGQLKRERGLRNEAQEDSIYTPVERGVKIFKPLVLPRALQKELPYKYKLKNAQISEKQKGPKRKRSGLQGDYSARVKKVVVRNDYESKVSSVMDKLRMSFEEKEKREKQATHNRIMAHRNALKAEEEKRLKKQKVLKKELCKKLGRGKSNEFR